MKLQKFKNLLAHTLGTLTYTLPATLSAALLVPNFEGGGLAAAFIIPGIIQCFFLMSKFVEGKELDSTIFKAFNAHYWKSVVDMPEVKKVQQLQKRVLTKLRQGTVDAEVIETYKNYKLNAENIKDWSEATVYHKTSRDGSYARKVTRRQATEQLNFKFDDIIEMVERLVPVEKLKSMMSGQNSLQSLNLMNFNSEKCEFAIAHGYVTALRAKDYTDFKKLTIDNNFERVFNFLTFHPTLVDWAQIKKIIVEDFTGLESVAANAIKTIDSIAPEQKYTPKIEEKKVGYANSVLDHKTIPRYGELKSSYDFLYQHQDRLPKGELEALNTHLNLALPLLATALSSAANMKRVSEAKSLVDSNLELLLAKLTEMTQDVESQIIKDLSVSQKMTKTMSASRS